MTEQEDAAKKNLFFYHDLLRLCFKNLRQSYSGGEAKKITLFSEFSGTPFFMVNSNLVELIKALHPEELPEFRLYLDSPFHNRGPQSMELIQLFERLMEAYPDFPAAQIDRDVIYIRLYGTEVHVKGKLDKIMSELAKQLRNFVVSNHYLRSENEFSQFLDWAVWLKNRGAEDRYKLVIDKLERMQEGEYGMDAKFHFRQFLLEQEKHDWEARSNQKKDDVNLSNVIRHLDYFYHLNHLEFLNRLLLQQTVTLIERPSEVDLNGILDNIPSQFLTLNPILFAEASIFRLHRYGVPPVEEVNAFMIWLNSHEQEMQHESLYRFWAYLRGLCSIQINHGHQELIPVLHQVHEDNLQKGYLFFEGKLSPSAYKNVAHVALIAGKTEWAFDFIEQYKDFIIGENESRDFYRSNLANFYFTVGAFEKALDILPAASSYSDYHSALRRLELKIYFELDSPLLLFKIDSFKMYVHRAAKTQHPEARRDLLLNFVNLLQQIVKSPKGDKLRSQQIIKRIEKKKMVAEKKWLIQKAQELASPKNKPH